MGRSWRRLAVGSCGLFILWSAVAAQAAEEFAAPPKAERDVVAAIGKGGGKITVDGEYRVTGVSLGNEATNDDLKALAACERLTSISIASPKVTDEGLEHLKPLTKLTSIGVNSTGTTAAGVTSLRAALPNCRVTTFGRVASAGGRTGGGDRGGPPGRGTSGFGTGGFGGSTFNSSSRTTSMLRNAAVQDDLKLTPEQRTQLADAASNSAINAVLKLIDEKVLAVLTAEQKARVKQLELQQSASSILRADVVAALKLAEEQVAAITKVNEEQAAASQTVLRDLFAQRGNETTEAIITKAREKTAEFNKQRDEKVQAVLNEEQKKAWKEMIGPPGPVVTSSRSAMESRFGTGGGPAQTPAAAAKVVFDRYDINRDNQLSDTEFPETNRTRGLMKAAGITLVYPVAREVFETNYAKYYEQSRRR
jgi:hypothetical protein